MLASAFFAGLVGVAIYRQNHYPNDKLVNIFGFAVGATGLLVSALA